MTPVLGISISSTHVRAVLRWRRAIHWAGGTPYADLEELASGIARLAGEAGLPARRARVVLERDVVQLRSIVPAPPLKPGAVRRYVALEAPRLFRRNGAPLVTDGVRVPVTKKSAALWAGAAPETLVQATLDGCAQAGLTVEALGPAADVLPCAFATHEGTIVCRSGDTTEILEVGTGGVWQSRLLWNGTSVDGQAPTRDFTPALAAIGDDAKYLAAAYAAAIALPRLSLLPPDARLARERRGRARLLRVALVGGALWLLAGGTYVSRIAWLRQAATRELGASAPAVDSALAVRRQLGMARATLATVSNLERRRSRHLELLASVTRALGDSTHLVAFQVTSDGTVRLAGYAPVAARAVAQIERVTILRDVRLEGPVTREAATGNRDRFAMVARLEISP